MVLRSKRELFRRTSPELDHKSDARTRTHSQGAACEMYETPNPFRESFGSAMRPCIAFEVHRRRKPRRKWLALLLRLSQSSGLMNSSGRSQTCVRVLIAAVLFAAFSWTLLVSVSPQVHGYIHDDANRTDHVCAITLIASGSYEQASQPPVITAPQPDICFAAIASLTPAWVKPLFLNAHVFAHAPPAYS